MDKPIPNDENDLHYGAGQTEVELTLRVHTRCNCFWATRTTSLTRLPSARTGFTRDGRQILACGGADLGAGDSPSSPPGAHVYIISPVNGSYVSNTFTVQFGLTRMGVAPAGDR